MRIFQYSMLFLFVAAITTGCRDAAYWLGTSKDPVVVRVGDRKLFQSQLEGLIHEGTSPEDSAAIVDGYKQNWILENLMIIEAEKNIAADINLNKLVEDYRSSLLVLNYEKRLIESNLDTNVTNAEKYKYYQMNKAQYSLSHPVFKCIISKIPSSASGIQQVKSALQKSDLTEAMFLIKEKSIYHHIDTAAFMTVEDLASLLPPGTVKENELGRGKVFTAREGRYEYFYKIIAFYDENTIPPFEYISDRITKSILSERKKNLLLEYRQNLYNRALDDQIIETYSNE